MGQRGLPPCEIERSTSEAGSPESLNEPSFIYWVRGRWCARLLLSISVYAVGLFEAPWREDRKIEDRTNKAATHT